MGALSNIYSGFFAVNEALHSKNNYDEKLVSALLNCCLKKLAWKCFKSEFYTFGNITKAHSCQTTNCIILYYA